MQRIIANLLFVQVVDCSEFNSDSYYYYKFNTTAIEVIKDLKLQSEFSNETVFAKVLLT